MIAGTAFSRIFSRKSVDFGDFFNYSAYNADWSNFWNLTVNLDTGLDSAV